MVGTTVRWWDTCVRWWAQLKCLAGPVSGLINVAADIQDREGELALDSKGLHATLLQDTRNYNPLLWTPLHQIAIQHKEDLLCGAYPSSLDTVPVGSTSRWSSKSSSTARTVHQLMVGVVQCLALPLSHSALTFLCCYLCSPSHSVRLLH